MTKERRCIANLFLPPSCPPLLVFVWPTYTNTTRIWLLHADSAPLTAGLLHHPCRSLLSFEARVWMPRLQNGRFPTKDQGLDKEIAPAIRLSSLQQPGQGAQGRTRPVRLKERDKARLLYLKRRLHKALALNAHGEAAPSPIQIQQVSAFYQSPTPCPPSTSERNASRLSRAQAQARCRAAQAAGRVVTPADREAELVQESARALPLLQVIPVCQRARIVQQQLVKLEQLRREADERRARSKESKRLWRGLGFAMTAAVSMRRATTSGAQSMGIRSAPGGYVEDKGTTLGQTRRSRGLGIANRSPLGIKRDPSRGAKDFWGDEVSPSLSSPHGSALEKWGSGPGDSGQSGLSSGIWGYMDNASQRPF